MLKYLKRYKKEYPLAEVPLFKTPNIAKLIEHFFNWLTNKKYLAYKIKINDNFSFEQQWSHICYLTYPIYSLNFTFIILHPDEHIWLSGSLFYKGIYNIKIMSMSVCAMTGQPLRLPVVSTKTGHLY